MLDKLLSLDNLKRNEVAEIISYNFKHISDKAKEGLKILAPDQRRSRLLISLGQLNAGNNSENVNTKLDHYCILCTDQNKLQNNSIKALLFFTKTVKQVNHTGLD